LADSVKSRPGLGSACFIPRDEPVHLSGFWLRTHQHFSAADANCCQSVPLDPNAMIGIDLHKWLFLLVTGRGE
jgi:hypothetical protein